MKPSQFAFSFLTKAALVVAICFIQTLTWAQDKGLDIDVKVDKGGDWYANPIVWIIGGAVFILLLVALLRGNKNA